MSPSYYGDWTRFRSDEEGKRATVHDFLKDHSLMFPGIDLKGSGFGALIQTVRLPELLADLDLGSPIELRLDTDHRNQTHYWNALRSDRVHREVHWSCRIYRLPEGASMKSREVAPGLTFTVDEVIPLPGCEGPFGAKLDLHGVTPWNRPVIDPGGVTTFDRASRTYYQTEPIVGPMFVESPEIEMPGGLVELVKKTRK
jgi:hypothetical protein